MTVTFKIKKNNISKILKNADKVSSKKRIIKFRTKAEKDRKVKEELKKIGKELFEGLK